MIRSRRSYVLFMALFGIVALALAGCSAPATAVPPTPVPPPPPTAAPTAAPTSAPAAAGPVTLEVVQNDKLGKFLADGQGRTLYMFMKDTKDTTNCYDKCIQNWPALLSTSAPTLKDGVSDALIGKTTRKEGTTQITYNGWPLYYYITDKNPGDTTGQAVGKVWWVLSPEGNILKPSGLQLAQNDKLGKFLADENGRALYMFTKDTKDTSNCYDKCEAAWPPLLTTGQPALQDGVDSKLLGTTKRKDGSVQITYNGMPLYYYAPDQAPGDVKGQGVGNVWYVVTGAGEVMK